MTALLAPLLASNSSQQSATGNPPQPHTEPPLKANESFIMILLFSLWLLKRRQLTLLSVWVSMCVCVLNLTCVSTCMQQHVWKGIWPIYGTHIHVHTHFPTRSTCAPLYWPSASFPERHIKGHVHSGALCSLKCSRAAADPQILTFKPSGEKKESSRGRDGKGTCIDRWREVAFVVVQVGVVRFITGQLNLLWLNICLSTVNVCREERVYWCGGGSTLR